MPDACTYEGRKYSEGAVICQNGSEHKCLDGAWQPTGSSCDSDDKERSIGQLIIDGDFDPEAVDLPDEDPDGESPDVADWEDEAHVDTKDNKLESLSKRRTDPIRELAGYLATSFITDSGDIKGVLFEVDRLVNIILPGARDTKCTSRRVRNLSRSWRNVLVAARSGDADKVVAAARAFRHQAKGRSKMYHRCYKYMRRQHRDLREIADIALKIVALAA